MLQHLQFIENTLLRVLNLTISHLVGQWERSKTSINFNTAKVTPILTTADNIRYMAKNGVIGGYHEYNNENEPVIGHIGAAGSLNFAFGKHYVTYNGIMCNILVPRNIYFGYLTLYAQNLAAQVRGSTQPFISYDMLYEVKTVLPTDEVLDDFH